MEACRCRLIILCEIWKNVSEQFSKTVSLYLKQWLLFFLCKVVSFGLHEKCYQVNGRSSFDDCSIYFLTKCLDVDELENLLRKQAPLEAYIEWLDSVVDRCVIKVPSSSSVVTNVSREAGRCLSSSSLRGT